MTRRWAIVRRSRELEALRDAVAVGTAVVLTGAAGNGKSTLVRELLVEMQSGDWSTALVSATRSIASVRYGAVAHLLPTTDPSGPLDVLRVIGGELAARADGKRLLVVIDDVHLLDDGSAGLVHQLVATDRAAVVATLRTGEAVPPAVAAILDDGRTRRIDVGPLALDEVGDVLTTHLGGPVDTTTVHRLWERTRGSPLFLRELVTAGLAQLRLRPVDTVWMWDGPLAVAGALLDLVRDRLAEVADGDRHAIELLAIAEPLPVQLLAGIGGWDQLERLERLGVVRTEHDGQRVVARLAHPLYADVLATTIGVVARRGLARELAATLATSDRRRRDDDLRLAVWSIDGELPIEGDVLLAAARHAAARSDNALAERIARAALAVGAPGAAVLLGEALFWQGRYPDAAAAAALADHAGEDPTVRAAAATCRASALFWGMADLSANDVLVTAEAELPPSEARDQLVAHRGSILLFAGRPLDALEAVGPVLERNEDNLAALRALSAAVPSWAVCGEGDRAIQRADAAMPLVLRHADNNPTSAGSIIVGRCLALWLTGRVGELEELTTFLYDLSVERREDELRGVWAFLLGRAALVGGRVDEARVRLREATSILRRLDAGRILPWCLAASAQAAAQGGAAAEAVVLARECKAAFRPAVRVYESELVLAEAWATAAGGDRAYGATRAIYAADVAAQSGQRAVEAVALHEAVRLGDARVHERLSRLASTVDGELSGAMAQHAEARAAGDASRLDEVSEAFDAIGARLYAAEAAAAAAELHERAGRSRARVASLERLRRLRVACAGARTPGLDVAASTVAHWLTRREREVAELAVQGQSKREIAERLGLSVRTVGNHLNHAYAKLGVSTREELGALLRTD